MASLVLDANVPTADPASRPKVGKFRKPVPPTFDDPVERRRYFKGRLALAARIMDGEGWGVGCSLGLSCRDPNEADLIWVIPRGKPPRAMGSKDLIGVRLDGSIVHPVEGREREYTCHVCADGSGSGVDTPAPCHLRRTSRYGRYRDRPHAARARV